MRLLEAVGRPALPHAAYGVAFDGAKVGKLVPPSDPLLRGTITEPGAASSNTVGAMNDVATEPIGADAPEITARFRDPGGKLVWYFR